ncbi:class I SAM-dependent methyltransferase [Chlorobium sp. KB01]|uniref:class I SAM-dependent methyltransferase n=1 Tax=Chlorobium sp. KB01 TaxID=1917528 RepID=UPI000977C2C7|nr:class I SAM-dependent methyltransferase [Chlorobium sp. KB01]
MLQLKTAGFKALDNLRREGVFPPDWKKVAELETVVNSVLSRFLEERFRVSEKFGGGFLLPELIDRALRTTENEHMDDRNLPECEKLKLVNALDRQNAMMQLYQRYVDLLLPMLLDIARREQRNARVVELACGSGGLTLALGEAVRQKKLPVTVTGSDIVPAYIDDARRKAAEKNIPAEFRRLNALELTELKKDEFDVMVLAQSLHHFTPGQLAVIIARSREHATTAFVGIDGYRSLLLAGGVPLIAAMQGITAFTLDGLTSARKFYTELELDMIAEIATGKRDHQLACSWPLSILSVRF